MEDESAEVREHAAEALGTVCQSESSAVPGLVLGLRDTDEKVRRDAAFSLARLGPHAEEATAALCSVLFDENRYVRGNATQALVRIGTPRSIAAVVPYLETSRWCPLTTKDSTF
jgi:HEAT repeat protein